MTKIAVLKYIDIALYSSLHVQQDDIERSNLTNPLLIKDRGGSGTLTEMGVYLVRCPLDGPEVK